MQDFDIKEQLNREIESVELPDRVLNNLLLKMREEKSAVATKKKPWYAIPKRFQSAIAVCGLALVMVVALPFALKGNEGNVGISEAKVPNPQSFISSKSVDVVEVPFKELAEKVPEGVSIPIGDENAKMSSYVLVGHSNTVNGVKVGYEYGNDTAIIIDMQIGGTNPMESFEDNEKIDIAGKEVGKSSYPNNSGTYILTIDKVIYYVSYVNLEDTTKVEKIIEDLLTQ